MFIEAVFLRFNDSSSIFMFSEVLIFIFHLVYITSMFIETVFS